MIQFLKISTRHLPTIAILSILFWSDARKHAAAQGNLLLAPHHSLMQSHFNVNPAFVPGERLTISIPPLLPPYPFPSFGFSISSSAFRLSEVIKPGTNGQTLIDTRAMLNGAKSMNTVAASFQAELLGVGYRLNNHHFISLQISNRAEMTWEYSKDMLKLLLQGNGAEGLLGKDLSPSMYLDGIHYTSLGIGYATCLKEGRFNAGIRLRYLSGQEHIQTRKSQVELYTDAADFSLRGSSDIHIRTSGLQNGIFQGKRTLISSDYLLGTGNIGAGLDAGASYVINERWKISAAVIDLGYIHWKNDMKSFRSKEPGTSLDFQGVDLTDYQNETITVQEAFEELTDSLGARFDLIEDDRAYSSMLNPSTVASLTYTINKHHSACLFIQNTFYDKRPHADISLSYSFSSGKWFNSTLAWSYIDRTAGNIGLFLSAQTGAFQLFLCGENIPGTVFFDRYSRIPVPAYTHHASLRTGFNLILGKIHSNR